jgi:hypothetical protein
MGFQINGLKHTESGVDELELINTTFETKELAVTYLKDNLELVALNDEVDVVVLNTGTQTYHYFEIVEVI